MQNFWGRHGFSHNSSGKAGLIFSLDINNGEKFLNSNRDWQGTVNKAYGDYQNDHDNFRLPERSIDYNPRNELCKYSSVQEFGSANIAPWGKLVKRPIPLLKNYGLKNYTKLETTIVGDKKIIKAYLPYNMTVNPYFIIENWKISTDPLEQDLKISTDNKFNVIKYNYHLENGINKFEGMNYISGQYVIYEMPQNIEIKELKYRRVGYNNNVVGSFKCSDKALNKLWDKAEKSLYINMRDTYTDCPDREKAQWWGDLVNEMTEAFYVYDFKNTPQLTKKGIYELAKWQRFDNIIYSPVPSGLPLQIRNKTGIKCNQKNGKWSRELPHQMLTSIGYYGFYAYYLYSGDKETIENIYDNVRRYLSVWKLDPKTGLVTKRKGGWYWGDWGSNKDDYLQLNCFYYAALEGAKLMAKVVGKEKDIADYETKQQSIKNNFEKYFWTGSEYRSKGYKHATDDRANAMAVNVGLAKENHYNDIAKVLATEYHASPYMEKYVLEALFRMGKSKQAIERMKKRWLPQINSKSSTLFEFWETNTKQGTYNHGWSGGGLLVMYQYIAGIRPIRAGFKEFVVAPQVGSLTDVATKFETRYGVINFYYNKEHKIITLTIPNGTSAIIDLGFIDIAKNAKIIGIDAITGTEVKFKSDHKQMLTAGKWTLLIK